MKPIHDELYQLAISSKLASSILLTQRRPAIAGLPVGFSVALSRPNWRPAYPAPTKNDLLVASVEAFDRSWSALRSMVEQHKKPVPLWHDDPAFFFECSPACYLARTACIGHEGQVFYFVYRNEDRWLTAVQGAGCRLFGEGEASYRRLIPVPGKYAG